MKKTRTSNKYSKTRKNQTKQMPRRKNSTNTTTNREAKRRRKNGGSVDLTQDVNNLLQRIKEREEIVEQREKEVDRRTKELNRREEELRQFRDQVVAYSQCQDQSPMKNLIKSEIDTQVIQPVPYIGELPPLEPIPNEFKLLGPCEFFTEFDDAFPEDLCE